uniref:Peptidase S1 domain-containing protein n=1 Tax=Timema cristinae TaxID=61476 RepID=A0A7R9H8R1_TIMCR|nr:unnamed protein product [Timema cristinae]
MMCSRVRQPTRRQDHQWRCSVRGPVPLAGPIDHGPERVLWRVLDKQQLGPHCSPLCQRLATLSMIVLSASSFVVTLGGTYVNSRQQGSVTVESRSSVVNQAFDPDQLVNDVALVQLPYSIPSSGYIDTIRLPSYSESTESFVGQNAVISGWGRTSDDNNGLSSVLEYVSQTVISNEQCAQTYGAVIDQGKICVTGYNDQSTCNVRPGVFLFPQGDSGGPLVLQDSDGLYTQIGIVSFGPQAGCTLGYPTAYTRVSQYLQWISTYSGIRVHPTPLIKVVSNPVLNKAPVTICGQPKVRYLTSRITRSLGTYVPLINMKTCVALILLIAAAQAKVSSLVDLEPRHMYVDEIPSHTAAEWEQIYKNQEYTPEFYPDYIPGTEPQEESAGKVSVTLPEGRIISGTTAARGQIPWQAFVILGGSGLCGGSLISNQWVLTAAHCAQGTNYIAYRGQDNISGTNAHKLKLNQTLIVFIYFTPNSVATFAITLGATSRTAAQTGTVTQTVRSAIIHSSYNPNTITNDIAVIRLNSAVATTSFITPVRLPRFSQASTSFAGSAARVSGFGRISSTTTATSANLLFADVNIITNAVCANTFGTSILASNICTLGSSGRSPCNGDSGGPLVIQEADGAFTEVGVVSFGRANCPANSPAAFVRVSSYLQWLSTNTGIAIRA